MEVKLYGTEESVYTRIVRLVLLTKEVEFALVEADPFEGGRLPEDYEFRHPFRRIPAIEIDSMRLYETDAIVHYIDAIIDNPKLTPTDSVVAAQMRQIMRIVDNYAYGPLVWGIYVPVWWREGLAPAKDAVDNARHVLSVLERFLETSPGACFNQSTLATFYIASVLAAADSIAPGSELIDERPGLREWWDCFRMRPIMTKTRSKYTKF